MTEQEQKDFNDWFDQKYPVDSGFHTRSSYQKAPVMELMRAAYMAGLRKAETRKPAAVFEGYIDGQPVIKWVADSVPVGTELFAVERKS